MKVENQQLYCTFVQSWKNQTEIGYESKWNASNSRVRCVWKNWWNILADIEPGECKRMTKGRKSQVKSTNKKATCVLCTWCASITTELFDKPFNRTTNSSNQTTIGPARWWWECEWKLQEKVNGIQFHPVTHRLWLLQARQSERKWSNYNLAVYAWDLDSQTKAK